MARVALYMYIVVNFRDTAEWKLLVGRTHVFNPKGTDAAMAAVGEEKSLCHHDGD